MDFIKRRKKRESKNKYPKTTITVCIIITLAFFVLFTARLVDWQIVHGSEYRELAKRSTSYTVQTDATRGEILDKNGDGIVVNTTHYKIVIDKLYANEETLDTNLLALISLMTLTGDKWEDTLPIELSGNTLSYKKGAEDEIATLLSEDYLNLDENTTAQDCFIKLVLRYKIDENLSLSEQRNLVSVHYNMELTGYSSSNPYVFAKDIKRSTVSAVSENTQGVSGIDVQTYLVRKAQDSDFAPHILGALGSITEEEYEQLKDGEKTYSLTDSVGKFGIELAFENRLKGEGGMKIIKRNSDGTIVDTIETIDSKPGNTVYLTLDKKLQETAVKSLAENVKAAKAQGVATKQSYGGSGWGEDCETGAVEMLSV